MSHLYSDHTQIVLRETIRIYGEDRQIDKCIEECSELIKELLKWRNADDAITEHNKLYLYQRSVFPKRHIAVSRVADEIADVLITIETLKNIFPDELIETSIVHKIDRLAERNKADRAGEKYEY